MAGCAAEWVTTKDPERDRPVKIMRHDRILGVPRPASYYLSDIQPPVQSTEDKHFLSLISAWSYILSAHWVEALKSGSLDAQAEEWRNMYLITAGRLPPFAPSPLFGKTDESNLNIDIRKHLRRDHQLLSCRMYWVLETGERVLAHVMYKYACNRCCH